MLIIKSQNFSLKNYLIEINKVSINYEVRQKWSNFLENGLYLIVFG